MSQQSQLDSLFPNISTLPLPELLSKLSTELNLDPSVLDFFVFRYAHNIAVSQPITLGQLKQLLKVYAHNIKQVWQQYSNEVGNGGLHNQVVPISQGNENYKRNKVQIERYLRDKTERYGRCLEGYTEVIKGEDSRAVTKDRLFDFVRDLFEGMRVTVQGQQQEGSLWDRPDAKQRVEAVLEEYCRQVKKVDAMTQRVYVLEEDVLDFVEFWIRTDKDIVARYFDIPEEIENESPETNQKKNTVEVQSYNPQSKQFIAYTKSTALIVPQQKPSNQLSEIEFNILQTIQKYQKILKKSTITQKQRIVVLNTILNLQTQLKIYRNQLNPSVSLAPQRSTSSDPLSRLPEIYQIYCRKRYALGHHATFDDIQHQTKSMNLQKFMNFSHDFLVSYSTDYLKHLFKKHATNMLQVNYEKFHNIIKQLLESSISTTHSNDFLQKLQQFRNDTSTSLQRHPTQSTQANKYSFKITPHSGMTSQQIKSELQYRRQAKSNQKLQHQLTRVKQQVNYLKKVGLGEKAVELIKSVAKRSNSSKLETKLEGLLPVSKEKEKLTITNLEKFKDRSFDPMKIIADGGDEEDDQYLRGYRLTEDKGKVGNTSSHQGGSTVPINVNPTPSHFRSKTKKSLNMGVGISGGGTRGLSETRMRELDSNQKSHQVSILENLEKNRKYKLQRGLKVVSRVRNTDF